MHLVFIIFNTTANQPFLVVEMGISGTSQIFAAYGSTHADVSKHPRDPPPAWEPKECFASRLGGPAWREQIPFLSSLLLSSPLLPEHHTQTWWWGLIACPLFPQDIPVVAVPRYKKHQVNPFPSCYWSSLALHMALVWWDHLLQICVGVTFDLWRNSSSFAALTEGQRLCLSVPVPFCPTKGLTAKKSEQRNSVEISKQPFLFFSVRVLWPLLVSLPGNKISQCFLFW